VLTEEKRRQWHACSTKLCQRCGKEYQPTNPNQKYCAECRPAANRTRIAAYCIDHRDKRSAYDVKYAKEHPEKGRARTARYGAAHPEKQRLWGAARRKANPEKERLRVAEYKHSHSEKVRLKEAVYKHSHPEKAVVQNSNRRAFKYSNTPISDMLTSTEWLAILAEADGHCAYCDKEAKLTLDHVIPLSKGGRHSKDNVVPACGHCNSSKGNKTLEEWNAKRLIQATQ